MNVICENVRCFQPDCQLRHPKTCRYFSTYSYCKFGDYCKFGHGEIRNSNIDKEIDNLKSEIETLKKVIEGKDTQIKEKDEEIRKMLDVDKTKVEEKLKKRINCLEKQNENLEVKNKELNFFKTFICIFSINMQLKYTCDIFNLQPRDAISYFDDYCQGVLQLGVVQSWSCCFR